MTEPEFKDELERLSREYYDKREAAICSYAKEINPYAVGMILRDHFQTIVVEEMRVLFPTPSGLPTWKYTGPRLTKGLRPYKNGDQGLVFQENVKEVMEEKIMSYKTKDGEYIYMVWDSEPLAFYIRGHVSAVVAQDVIKKEELEVANYPTGLREFGEPVHKYGHWGFASINAPDGCDEEFRAYDKPGRGRFKVTEIPVVKTVYPAREA